jgi:rubredoxin
MFESTVDRRGFLRGSALFAAAIGLKVASPAAAQQEQDQDQDQSRQKPQEKKDPFASDEKAKSGEKTYIDQEGREYRICPQCAYNMYKQGRMWVCDNCGYSYVE